MLFVPEKKNLPIAAEKHAMLFVYALRYDCICASVIKQNNYSDYASNFIQTLRLICTNKHNTNHVFF